jgi:hypothetical protein
MSGTAFFEIAANLMVAQAGNLVFRKSSKAGGGVTELQF